MIHIDRYCNSGPGNGDKCVRPTSIRFKFFFCAKRSVSDSYTIRKNNGEKSESESSKMREKQILGP